MKSAHSEKSRETILVYDYNSSGHCPGWMHLVATGFRQAGAEVLVACRLETPEVRPWADRLADAGCRLVDVAADGICHASDAAALARREGVKRVFFPNFDSVVYEMGKHGVCGVFDGFDVGGIWLRPELSGGRIGRLLNLWMKLARGRANKLARRHARAVANNRRGLAEFMPPDTSVARTKIFFTSADAAMETAGLLGNAAVDVICDPWIERACADKATACAELGIPEGRIVLLHAGTSRPEKGLKDACDALLTINPGLLDKVCLLRAGRVDPLDAPALERLRATGAAMVLDYFVEEEVLAKCYAAADWVLLPYRDQKETSGLLIHAAANARPVIASDFGVIGRDVKKHHLGRLFAHRDTKALAALCAEVVRTSEHETWDSAGMDEFAHMNSPEAFRRTLVDGWLLAEHVRHHGECR